MSKVKQLQGNSITAELLPEVKIISMSDNPVGLIGAIWYGSRQNDSINPLDLQLIYNRVTDCNPNLESQIQNTANRLVNGFPQYYDTDKYGSLESNKDVELEGAREVLVELVKICLRANLPVSESVALTIQVDNASVAWREQLVRSKFSSYFVTTSRIADLSKMDVVRPHAIRLIAGDQGVKIFDDTVQVIRDAYRKLEELGVPQEDIRLQPQMNTHRVFWMTDLRALITTLRARCGWIAQSSLWSPIHAGICRELRYQYLMEVLDEFLGEPPVKLSIDNDDNLYVSEYQLKADNEDRILGKDPLPVDPLYLAHIQESMPEHTDIAHYDYLKSMYINTWNDRYLSVLGWNRDNPDQLGPYDRPRSYFESLTDENSTDELKSVKIKAIALKPSRGNTM